MQTKRVGGVNIRAVILAVASALLLPGAAQADMRGRDGEFWMPVNGGDKADHLAAQIQAIERAPSGMARAFSR